MRGTTADHRGCLDLVALATRGGERVSYLTCPTCRLTVFRPLLTMSEDCPRCKAKMGKASRLFQSSAPPRLLDPHERPAASERR